MLAICAHDRYVYLKISCFEITSMNGIRALGGRIKLENATCTGVDGWYADSYQNRALLDVISVLPSMNTSSTAQSA